jgi:hypothetical protein
MFKVRLFATIVHDYVVHIYTCNNTLSGHGQEEIVRILLATEKGHDLLAAKDQSEMSALHHAAWAVCMYVWLYACMYLRVCVVLQIIQKGARCIMPCRLCVCGVCVCVCLHATGVRAAEDQSKTSMFHHANEQHI